MSSQKWVMDDIVCADSRHLSSFVKPNSVALTVTSPPYRNAIDYKRHIAKRNENYRGKRVWDSLDDYLKDMKEIFDQVYKVTKRGGYCAIVIGLEVINAEIIPLPFYFITRLLKENRWILREEIIWNKVTAGRRGVGNRFGSTIKNPYPGYYHANIMHEHILVFSKGETNPRLRKEEAVERVRRLNIDDLMKRDIANSTWHIAPVPPRSIKHPCPFPEQIPWRLIQLYTYVNDVVLDPFNGSGQTTKVARHLARHYIGVDVIEEYVELAKERLEEKPNLSTLLYVKPGGWGSSKTWWLQDQI